MNKKIIALENMKKKEKKLIEELGKAVKHNRNAIILKRDDCKMIVDCVKDLQEQVYEYEQLIDIQDKRKYHKRYLEERRKEEPNLLYPDYDEVYKRYYEQKDTIDKAIKYITSNEWAKDYELSSCRTHLLDILRGEK